MSTADRITVHMMIDSTSVDVTDRVMRASWFRGRRTSLAPDGPGSATIVLDDPDRDFDPLNVGSRTVDGKTFDETDLCAELPVQIRIQPEAGDNHAQRWAGFGRLEPTVWTGDGHDTNPQVIVRCFGLVGALAVPVAESATSRIMERVQAASSSVFYAFRDDNDLTASNIVEDLSGSLSDGFASADETSAPPTAWTHTSAGIRLARAYGTVIAPMQDDPVRRFADGFFAGVRCTLTDDGSSHGGASNYEWVLWSEGGRSSAPQYDGVWLVLEETRVGNSTAGTNPMTLKLETRVDSSGASDTVSLSVGTHDDWEDHDRWVMVSVDQAAVNLGAHAIGDSTIGGAAKQTSSSTGTYVGPAQPNPSALTFASPRMTRFGRGPGFTTAGLSFVGDMRLAVAAYGGSAARTFDDVMDLLDADEADSFLPATTGDQMDTLTSSLDGIGGISRAMTDTSDATLPVSEAHDRRATVLARVLELAETERGRIIARVAQNTDETHSGVEFVAASSVTGDVSQATLTDQNHGAAKLNYLEADITDGQASVINEATVTTVHGHEARSTDATSVALHGTRHGSYSPPLTADTDADTFADDIVNRFGTAVPHVSRVRFDPDTGAWWPLIKKSAVFSTTDGLDLASRLVVVRQPGGVGSVMAREHVLEGEEWAWDPVADRFVVDFFLSPLRHTTGFDPATDLDWHSLWWAEGEAALAEEWADGDAVATWPNETGETDATAFGTGQPVWRLNRIGGRPAFDFSGGNHAFAATFGAAPSYTSGVSVVAIVNAGSAGADYVFDGVAAGNRNAIYNPSGTTIGIYAGGSTTYGGVFTASADHAAVAFFDGSTGADKLRLNGTETVNSTGPGSHTLTGLTIAARYTATWSGIDVALMGVYEGDITADSNFPRFQAWASDAYGLTL